MHFPLVLTVEKESFYNFIKDGDVMSVKNMVLKGADIHMDEEAPLRIAAEWGYLDITQFFIELGADIHVRNDVVFRNAVNTGNICLIKYLAE